MIMEKNCAEHERVIVERVSQIVEDKVELAVTSRLSSLSKWVTGTIIGILGMFVVVLLSNSYYMGKMDAQYNSVLEYIAEQKIQNDELKKLNVTLSEKLNETISDQMVILANMKKLDPSFVMPFQLRGSADSNKN